MLKLEPEEKIMLILHHHWISIIGPAFLILFLFTAPLFLLPMIMGLGSASAVMPLFIFGLWIWYLIMLVLGFILWIDYYFDALVVTDVKIIKINQEGAFKYEVSEFKLGRVQDITIEIPNFIGTLLGYGNITIQTAGEINFTIKEIPRVNEVKDLILRLSRKGASFIQ